MRICKSKLLISLTAALMTMGSVALAAEYKVPVKLMKAYEDAESMGAKALIPEAKVVEENGKSDIYLSFKGIDFMNMHGHLVNLKVYPNGVSTDNSSLVQAETVEYMTDKGLDGTDKEFPSVFKMSRDKTRESVIGVRINVDAMDFISGDSDGSQAARVFLDYDNAVEIKKDSDVSEKPEVPSKDEEVKEDEKIKENEEVKVDKEIIKIEKDKDENLNGGYVNGYPDGSFRPDNNMTRSEAAKILTFALAEDFDSNKDYKNSFNDVSEEAWYANYVSYLYSKGYINGKGEGMFAPEDSVTRAEFVTMIVNIMNKDSNSASEMTDIAGHWAESKIKTAVAENWIKGYSDSSFKPDKNISRAEVVKIINRVKNINIDKDKINENIKAPTDVDSSHWAYYDILAATVQ